MPIHDWNRVPSGLFHHFHQDWSIELARTLNRGILPSNLAALVEQRAGVKEPDILAINVHDNLERAARTAAHSGNDRQHPDGIMNQVAVQGRSNVPKDGRIFVIAHWNRFATWVPCNASALIQLSPQA